MAVRLGSNKWAYGEDVSSADLNDTFDAVRPPIGTIMPWLKDLTGVPQTLPWGWVECNGQTISDPESPLNGVTLPNLNGENRFLRGNTTSGGTGGSETHTHTIYLSGDKDYAAGYDASNDPKVDQGTYTTSTESNLPPYYNVVWIIRIK